MANLPIKGSSSSAPLDSPGSELQWERYEAPGGVGSSHISCVVCNRWIFAGAYHDLFAYASLSTHVGTNIDSSKQTHQILPFGHMIRNHKFPIKDDFYISKADPTTDSSEVPGNNDPSESVDPNNLVHPMSLNQYCSGCKGVVCHFCVRPVIEASACPQCLSVSPYAAPSISSISTSSNMLFGNRCKKCSGCPECGSPSLSIKSISPTSIPKALLPLLHSLPSTSSINSNSSSTAPASASRLPAINFYSCPYCRWNSIESPALISATMPSSFQIPSPRSLPKASSNSNFETAHVSVVKSTDLEPASSPSNDPLSASLFAESTTKLLNKALARERNKRDSTSFSSIVQQRAASTRSTLKQERLSSLLNTSQRSSSFQQQIQNSRNESTSTAESRSNLSTKIGPSIAQVESNRTMLQSSINSPSSQFPARNSSDLFNDSENQLMNQEEFTLDRSRILFEADPLVCFYHDMVMPANTPSSNTRLFANHSIVDHPKSFPYSPIANISTLHIQSANSPAAKPPPSSSSNALSYSASIDDLERLPLYPICSKRCLKCDRVLVKPSVVIDTSAPVKSSSSASITLSSAPLTSNIEHISSLNASTLPDFKRRHDAMSYSPLISVKASEASGEYRPCIKRNEWNMISITIMCPPLIPAAHVVLKPLFEQNQPEPEAANATSDDKQDIDNTNADESQLKSVMSFASVDALEDVDDEQSRRLLMESQSYPPIASNSHVAPFCAVDCNGCDTWILEDESVMLSDDLTDEIAPKPVPQTLLPAGVPTQLELLEKDSDNPAILGRKSRQVTLLLMAMPSAESKNDDVKNDLFAFIDLDVSWPAPLSNDPTATNSIHTTLRIDLSRLFDPAL